MSRKKTHSGKILSRLLKIVELETNGKPSTFAKKAGIPPSTFQYYIKGRFPRADHLQRICVTYNLDINWLLTGIGEPYLKIMENKKEDEIFRGDENDILYNRVGPDEDPEIADLVSRTVEVLKSDMDCSASLAAIIRSFHHTMRAEREVSKLKSRITAIEERQKKSEEIRKEDPPEKKEEFLKRRAM